MTPAESARAALATVRALETRRADLRAVERAWAEYATALADDQRAADIARADVDRVKAELARAAAPAPDPEDWGGPDPLPRGSTLPAPPPLPPPPVKPPPPDRRAFRRQVNQFRRAWGIDDGLLGRLNGIVDAPDRPLGEALALLPDTALDPTAGESAAAHEARMRSWAAALAEYADALAAEMLGLEGQNRGREGIAEAWAARGARWDALVAARRAELRADAEKFRTEADGLRAKLGRRGTA